MVRGLIIRQAFIVVDLLLAVAIVLAAFMVLSKLFDPPVLARTLEPALPTEIAMSMVPRVGPVESYQGILRSGLFGDAGRWDPGAAPPPEPVVEAPKEEVDTSLNLRLIGTSALRPMDPLASAIIQNLDDQTGGSFAINQEVISRVTLVEVRPREVVLLNQRDPEARREVLRMSDNKDRVAAPKPVGRFNLSSNSATERVTLDRQEFIQDLYVNYADIVTKVKPELYRDASGRVVGVTSNSVSQVPLAQKLGLNDGDVLQTVNNEQIDSEQKIMEMVQKYRNAGSFRLGILRNGRPKVITYRLE